MKIYNIKIRAIILALILFFVFIFSFLFFKPRTIIMTNENYTKILKEIHDNPYKYENRKIEMNGYIFRAPDFNENQFVVARDMIVSESDARIVGFLCEYNNAVEYSNNSWVNASGKITVGDYHGAMPIVAIETIEDSVAPTPPHVYLPTDMH